MIIQAKKPIIKLENWLALYHSPKVGSVRFQQYLQYDPYLETLPANICPDWQQVTRDLRWLNNTPNAHILTMCDHRYPNLLKQISGAPPILYVLGDATCLNDPQIAMVGSRTPTSVGLKTAYDFARYFANLGITITSGMALGIDGASHKGALQVSDAKTIGVLAHGLDMLYPLHHRDLSLQVQTNGCLVSEFGIGVPTHASFFPRRNRIISGLSLGVLVVEAAINSGSLITARYAADQGRDVFTIPGSIHSPKAKGCHELIKQGAKLVESAQEVLEELANLLKYVIRDKTLAGSIPRPREPDVNQQQRLVLDNIDTDLTCLDMIVARSGLVVSVVSAILLELELQGFITAVSGGFIRKLG